MLITIDKAIEKLKNSLPDKDEPIVRLYYDSLQLGIEALKRIRNQPDGRTLLPGEKEE